MQNTAVASDSEDFTSAADAASAVDETTTPPATPQTEVARRAGRETTAAPVDAIPTMASTPVEAIRVRADMKSPFPPELLID